MNTATPERQAVAAPAADAGRGTAREDWGEANQRQLSAALAVVKLALRRHTSDADAGSDTGKADAKGDQPVIDPNFLSALGRLSEAFSLSEFEAQLLVLCAGMELESELPELCGRGQNNDRPYATFSLAMAALPNPHWDAINPSAPLRFWRLVEVSEGSSLVTSRLRIDERILHYLTGISYVDDRFWGLAEIIPEPEPLAPSQSSRCEELAVRLLAPTGRPVTVNLCGSHRVEVEDFAASLCARLGVRGYRIRLADIPASYAEREALARLWKRETILSSCILIVDEFDASTGDGQTQSHARAFVESLDVPIILTSREPVGGMRRPIIRADVPRPDRSEQRDAWRNSLGDNAVSLNGTIDRLVGQFDFGLQAIRSAGLDALTTVDGAGASGDDDSLGRRLWESCRIQCRQGVAELAQRIEPTATWDDIVLPQTQLAILHDIAAQVHQRTKVYDTWGFAKKSNRGLGIAALFSGPSGTGKTMAAEVLANDLKLDLYHIDLSQMVSKYIGETEKNLARIFDAAERGGAILLFDEADALFGKRSEVKDSRDRYANIEVSYLLQRIESYRGLAILTTNQKSAIDDAFQRRIRFLVNFPFPDAAGRAEIWRRIFPEETPREGLDVDALARLNVPGGIIRNIALHAAFLAADVGGVVRMNEIQQATRRVYARLEKALNESELRGWL